MDSETTHFELHQKPWRVMARSLPSRHLKLGDSGLEVQHLQAVLQGLYFYVGPLDGHFGTATERAVLRLQRQLELRETGHFNQTTRLALGTWAETPLR
jgi:peptidoglycan hydrolase-like protein with peptidoglycan-binding domain